MVFIPVNDKVALRMIGWGWKRCPGKPGYLYWPEEEMPRA